MIYEVRLAPKAALDLRRLGEFLAEKSPRASDRAIATIVQGLKTLEQLPSRGRPFKGSLRELRIAFSQDGYVVRYRLDENVVVVTRIFHAREHR